MTIAPLSSEIHYVQLLVLCHDGLLLSQAKQCVQPWLQLGWILSASLLMNHSVPVQLKSKCVTNNELIKLH